jgi:hypothetical protein
MKSSVTVPSAKIKLLLGLIKRSAKMIRVKEETYVYFTTAGLFAVVDNVHICVPLILTLNKNDLMLKYTDIEFLSKSEGDVTFLCRNGKAGKQDSDGYSELRKSHRVQGCEGIVWVTHTEHGVAKTIIKKCVIANLIDLEYHRIPETTIDSPEFLSTIAMCTPYLQSTSGETWADCFCFNGGEIIATDRHRIIAVKDTGIDSLVFYDSAKKITDQFLMRGLVSALLPKSGTCRLASRLEPIREYRPETDEHTKRNVTVFYIISPDYYIVTEGVKGQAPAWEAILDEPVKDARRLHIDKRDAQTCIKQLKVLPRGRYDMDHCIHLCFDEGRLCVDSCADDTPNVRLRFSEFTTGSVDMNNYTNAGYLSDALQVAAEAYQNPPKLCVDNGVEKAVERPLCFTSDSGSVMISVMTHHSIYKDQRIANIVEVKDHWEQQPKKQPKSKSRLSAHSDSDLIASLKLENEQLKKEIASLRNKT